MRIQKCQVSLIVVRHNYVYIQDHRQKLYVVHVNLVKEGQIDKEETHEHEYTS